MSFDLYQEKQMRGRVVVYDKDGKTILEVQAAVGDDGPGQSIALLQLNQRHMRLVALELHEALHKAGFVSADAVRKMLGDVLRGQESQTISLIETSMLASFEKVAQCVKRKMMPDEGDDDIRAEDGRVSFDVYYSQLLVGKVIVREDDWNTVVEVLHMVPREPLAPSPDPKRSMMVFNLHHMKRTAVDLYERLHEAGFVSADYMKGVHSGRAFMAKSRLG